MFDRILENIPDRTPSPRSTIKLDNYIDNLKTYRDGVLMRQDNILGAQQDGFDLFRKILADANVDLMQSITSDVDRYANYIRPILDELERIFDPVMRGLLSRSIFLDQTNRDAQEYIFPVHTISDLRHLPLDQGWEQWQHYRPFRMIYTDSRELSLNIHSGGIVFKEDPPTMAVFTINVPALVLQYARYRTDVPEDEQLAIESYLNKYVFKNGLLTDLIDNWLQLTFLNILQYPDIDDLDRSVVNASLSNNIYGYVGAQYVGGMLDIRDLVADTQNARIKPDRLLGSMKLLNESVAAKYHARNIHTQVLDVRQYEWVMFIRDYLPLQLLIHAYATVPNISDSVSFGRRAQRDLNLIARTRFWTNATDTDTRDLIEMHFDALHQLVNTTWG